MQRAPWQEIYEHGLVLAIFAPWSYKTIELVTPLPGESILDVACGTGVVACLAAQYAGAGSSIAGLDASPGMIEVAQMLPAPPGISIDWHHGDALALPFPDATFHIVFCQGGLQFFSDASKFRRCPGVTNQLFKALPNKTSSARGTIGS